MAPPVGLEPTSRPLRVPLWLPTAHCAVGLTRRALCALLAKQMAFGCGAAQARCFEPHLQNKKEIPDIRHLFVGSPSWTRTNDPAVNSRMLYRLSYRGILNCATLFTLLKYISTIRKFCQRFFRKNTKHFSKNYTSVLTLRFAAVCAIFLLPTVRLFTTASTEGTKK